MGWCRTGYVRYGLLSFRMTFLLTIECDYSLAYGMHLDTQKPMAVNYFCAACGSRMYPGAIFPMFCKYLIHDVITNISFCSPLKISILCNYFLNWNRYFFHYRRLVIIHTKSFALKQRNNRTAKAKVSKFRSQSWILWITAHYQSWNYC